MIDLVLLAYVYAGVAVFNAALYAWALNGANLIIAVAYAMAMLLAGALERERCRR